MFSSVPAFAQTTTMTSIASLQALLQSLLAQVQTLQTQLQAARQTQSEIIGTLKLISQLREGATGESVKLLQTILTADSDIYPEGIISGYFGKLTASAVRRFQKKHGLEQVGFVGPRTLKKLNEELDENPVSEETNAQGEKQKCAIVPPGHLIAPGWLRKQNGVKPVVPECQTLPPGILAKLGQTATSTPDIVAPVISGVSATNVSSTSAHILWTTNETANSKVWYSTSTPLNTATAAMVTVADMVLNHDVTLIGLNASSTYYYVVSSADAANNTATSTEASFVTLGQ